MSIPYTRCYKNCGGETVLYQAVFAHGDMMHGCTRYMDCPSVKGLEGSNGQVKLRCWDGSVSPYEGRWFRRGEIAHFAFYRRNFIPLFYAASGVFLRLP